ncbi:MAG: endolytic transglycosylase MltG [bacterium]|nr:endolytic transglycosylase MltG [bacterium]
MLRAVAVVLLLVATAARGGFLWLRHSLTPVAKDPVAARRLAFEVESGDSLGRVAATLEAEGMIRSAKVTRWFAESENIASQLKIGEYALSASQSTPEILDVLVRGRVQTHPVVIPEGLRAAEIADRMAAAGLADRDTFLAIALDPGSPERFGVEGPSLEGYLFPDTYRFARGVPEERIIEAMVGEFLQVYRELVPDPSAVELSMREHVTLASIVEKETGVAIERALIAAVFLNRMKRGMRLQTDPTVIYGIANFDGNIKRIHLEDASNPYNTYKIRGLPPGPIANAGRDALRAVLEPAESPYLFFVSRNDGTHIFAKSYAEHEANVDRYQRRRR